MSSEIQFNNTQDEQIIIIIQWDNPICFLTVFKPPSPFRGILFMLCKYLNADNYLRGLFFNQNKQLMEFNIEKGNGIIEKNVLCFMLYVFLKNVYLIMYTA